MHSFGNREENGNSIHVLQHFTGAGHYRQPQYMTRLQLAPRFRMSTPARRKEDIPLQHWTSALRNRT